MSRLTDTIISDAYGTDRNAPMVNLAHGGQNGFETDFTSYVSNAAYVRRNLIPFMMSAPTGFQLLPSPDKWVATLKALVELHPKTIEGLQSGLTVEFAENVVGGAGEMQEDVTNVTRARSTPTFIWTEKYGKPINSFLRTWITELMMDPISKIPGVVSNGSAKPTDILPDFTGMTVMFVEPDPTHTKVVHAWLCTNMMPKSDGTVEGKRELSAALEGIDYNIEFTALTQVGKGVNAVAQQLLDSLTLTSVNPNSRPAFLTAIDADVKAATDGYADQLAAAATNAVS